jgi:GH25 family lysozyme M1 (1,4-beta-N-acetylmuramidase)
LDCSKYQKDINWKLAKADGIDFAFVKITEGTTGHEDAVYNVKNRVLDAQKNGVKIGYYHFARPGNVSVPENDAKEEVQNVLNHLSVLPKANLPLVLDLESYSDTMLWTDKIEHMNRYISTFINTLKQNNINTIFYSYKNLPIPIPIQFLVHIHYGLQHI